MRRGAPAPRPQIAADLMPDRQRIGLEIGNVGATLAAPRHCGIKRKMTMQNCDDTQFTDLGDAVHETKGSAMTGVVDTLGGFRPSAGLSAED